MDAFPHESCTRARASVSVELDGELSELERQWLRGHLRQCRDCRGFERRVRLLTSMLRADLPARLRRPVRVSPRRSFAPTLSRVSRVGAAAATAAVALVIAAAGAFHELRPDGSALQPRFTVRSHDPPGFDDVHALRKQDVTARLAAASLPRQDTHRTWPENS